MLRPITLFKRRLHGMDEQKNRFRFRYLLPIHFPVSVGIVINSVLRLMVSVDRKKVCVGVEML